MASLRETPLWQFGVEATQNICSVQLIGHLDKSSKKLLKQNQSRKLRDPPKEHKGGPSEEHVRNKLQFGIKIEPKDSRTLRD